MINLPVQSMASMSALTQQRSPLDSLMPGIAKGMQMYYMPKQMQADLQNEQLKNALLQIEQQYKPQLDQADIASKNAYAQNFPLQTQIQQAQLAALLQKLNTTAKEPSKFQQQQILAQQTADAKAKAEQDKAWATLLNNVSNSSNAASALDTYANQFHQAYGNTSETGFPLGRLPAIGSDAQSADRAANNMVAQLANSGLLKGGRITNNQLAFLQGLKLSRALNSDAEVDAINQIKATDARLKEQLPFFQKAKDLGLSPDAAQVLWEKYNTEKPTYDSVNKKILSKNIGSWSQYLPGSGATNSTSGPNVKPNIAWGMPGSTINNNQEQKMMNFAKATHAPGIKEAIANNKSNITQEDLEFTAKKYGISVDDVKKKLGVA